MSLKYLISLAVFLAANGAYAANFSFACQDSATAPTMSIAGASQSHAHFGGLQYSFSGAMQVNSSGQIAISTGTGKTQTCSNCDTITMADSTQQNEVSVILPFGAGQITDLGSNVSLSSFTAQGTLIELNGDSSPATVGSMANIPLNCSAAITTGNGAQGFFSGLGSFWVNLIAGITFPQDSN